jgi:ADP-heptose:LPS heptosyltransferase
VVTERKNKAVWQGNPYIVGTIENLFWNVAGVVRKSDDVFTFGGIATILKKAMRYDPIEATFRLVGWPLPETKEQCRPKLIVTIDEGIAAENRLKELGIDIRKDKLITIGIEASTPNRSWPIEYARILTAKLTAEGKKVLWIGKNKDKSEAFLENLAKSCGAVNLNQKTDVRQAMALIAVSDLYIGPNSGLMVIATSLLIPTIGLFGAFKPSIRAKFYERFTGIWHKVACSPCNEHWTECQHGHPSPCMKVIIPEEVHREAVKLMAKYPRTIREKIPME